jgi:ribosomal protein L11 methylase PrmA
VLDVGCGIGTWFAEWRKLGVGTVRGYDGDHAALQIAPEEFVVVDLATRRPRRAGSST